MHVSGLDIRIALPNSTFPKFRWFPGFDREASMETLSVDQARADDRASVSALNREKVVIRSRLRRARKCRTRMTRQCRHGIVLILRESRSFMIQRIHMPCERVGRFRSDKSMSMILLAARSRCRRVK